MARPCVLISCCVAHGGDEFNSQYGMTALIWAAENDRTDYVQLLVDAGADTEAADDVRGSLAVLNTLSYSEYYVHGLIFLFRCHCTVCRSVLFFVYCRKFDVEVFFVVTLRSFAALACLELESYLKDKSQP